MARRVQLYENVLLSFCFNNKIYFYAWFACRAVRMQEGGHCARVSSVRLPLTLLISLWALIGLVLSAVGVWARKWRWDFGIKREDGKARLRQMRDVFYCLCQSNSLAFYSWTLLSHVQWQVFGGCHEMFGKILYFLITFLLGLHNMRRTF